MEHTKVKDILTTIKKKVNMQENGNPGIVKEGRADRKIDEVR